MLHKPMADHPISVALDRSESNRAMPSSGSIRCSTRVVLDGRPLVRHPNCGFLRCSRHFRAVRQHQGPILFHALLNAAIPLFLGQVGIPIRTLNRLTKHRPRFCPDSLILDFCHSLVPENLALPSPPPPRLWRIPRSGRPVSHDRRAAAAASRRCAGRSRCGCRSAPRRRASGSVLSCRRVPRPRPSPDRWAVPLHPPSRGSKGFHRAARA